MNQFGTHELAVCCDTLMRNAGEDHVADASLMLGEGQAINLKTRLAAKLLGWAKTFLRICEALQRTSNDVFVAKVCKFVSFAGSTEQIPEFASRVVWREAKVLTTCLGHF